MHIVITNQDMACTLSAWHPYCHHCQLDVHTISIPSALHALCAHIIYSMVLWRQGSAEVRVSRIDLEAEAAAAAFAKRVADEAHEQRMQQHNRVCSALHKLMTKFMSASMTAIAA